MGGPFEGADLLLLTTTAAKSGEPRLAPLAYLTVDGKTIIIGSYAGADIHPAWVHNPRAHVEVGTTDYDVLARELPPAERDEAFPKIVAAAPGFADYQPQDQPRHPAARDTEGIVAPNVISPAISYFAVETSFETRDEPHYTYRVTGPGAPGCS